MSFFARDSIARTGTIIRTKWIEAAALATLTLVVTPLTFARDEVVDLWRRFTAEQRNIAVPDALALARQKLGAQVIVAWPFRNAASEAQYIAVVVRMGSDESSDSLDPPMIDAGGRMQYRQVILLEGAGTDVIKYQEIDPELEAVDSFSPAKNEAGEVSEPAYSSSIAGVTDVNRDGNKEIYAVDRSGGMGVYSATITVYDVVTGVRYSLDAGGNYGAVILETQYSPNVSQYPAMRDWLAATVGTLNLRSDDSTTRNAATLRWLADQGVGFTNGTITIRKFPGPIPEAQGSPVCRVEADQFVWQSAFKDDLWAFDKSDNSHFLVYKSTWLSPVIVVGARNLWFGDAENALALDRKTFLLSPARTARATIDPNAELAQGKACVDGEDRSPDARDVWARLVGDTKPAYD